MKDINLKPLKTQKKSDAVYQILLERIINKSFIPGQRLDLSTIEKQLEVSRMPLRLALNRLEHEGLVDIVAQSGTYVANPTQKNIADSFDIRILLECYSVKLAAERITDQELGNLQKLVKDMDDMIQTEDWDVIYQTYIQKDMIFHKELASITGNQRLLKIIEQENTHIHGSRKLFNFPKNDLVETVREHKNILKNLGKRDEKKAEEAMMQHLRRVKRSLMMLLEGGR